MTNRPVDHQPVICPDCGHRDGHADECRLNPWRRLYVALLDLITAIGNPTTYPAADAKHDALRRELGLTWANRRKKETT